MRDWLKTEDWWAVWIGLLIFGLSLPASLGVDLLGWGVSTKEWLDVSKAMVPVSGAYTGLPGVLCLALTYLFLLAVLAAGAWVLRFNVGAFAVSFSVIFWLSYLSLLIGHYAYVAVTPNKRGDLGISWSLGLTGEAGFIVALVLGLVIGNFLPGVAAGLREANRPEWYVKTAIVILGAFFGFKAATEPRLAGAVLFRGFAAIIEAYLIYWALVYFIARRFFGFSREWAAPLASGISICGVSAAIATGAAIRARPIVPIMVSSLVVIFAVVELLILPFVAQAALSHEPLVAAAWMGLAVKTDGAAAASGAITEAFIQSNAAEAGFTYEKDWMLGTTLTVKVFIDIFIGVWAFVLALIWVYRIDKKPGERVRAVEIWERFPKFVLGYVLTFLVMLGLALALRPAYPKPADSPLNLATNESNVFRTLFFVMTFFTIGLGSNFRKLWAEGIGRLAAVYAISLFGFIIWIGLVISWVFFHGVHPPIAGGP
jgi:uncharacterized membrane protein YadS